jgi:hypothetical protein
VKAVDFVLLFHMSAVERSRALPNDVDGIARFEDERGLRERIRRESLLNGETIRKVVLVLEDACPACILGEVGSVELAIQEQW